MPALSWSGDMHPDTAILIKAGGYEIEDGAGVAVDADKLTVTVGGATTSHGSLEDLVESLFSAELLGTAEASGPPPPVDAFEGCLVGIALGDAIGLAVEGNNAEVGTEYVAKLETDLTAVGLPWEASPWVQKQREELEKQGKSWENRSPYSVGQISDDTECARELAVSIIENGGSFRVGHFGDRLAATHGDTQRIMDTVGVKQETGIVGQGPTSKYSLDRILEGESWMTAGRDPPVSFLPMRKRRASRLTGLWVAAQGGGKSNGAVMRVGPLGLLHWHQPGSPKAWADGALSSVPTHSAQALSLEAAAALSTVVSVAAACSERGDDDEVRQRSLAALAAEPHMLDWSGMLSSMLEAGVDSHGPAQKIMREACEAADPGGAAFAAATAAWAIYAFLKTPSDFWRTIFACIVRSVSPSKTCGLVSRLTGYMYALLGGRRWAATPTPSPPALAARPARTSASKRSRRPVPTRRRRSASCTTRHSRACWTWTG